LPFLFLSFLSISSDVLGGLLHKYGLNSHADRLIPLHWTNSYRCCIQIYRIAYDVLSVNICLEYLARFIRIPINTILCVLNSIVFHPTPYRELSSMMIWFSLSHNSFPIYCLTRLNSEKLIWPWICTPKVCWIHMWRPRSHWVF